MLSMAERMENAQISQSADALKYQYADSARGQWLGFATAIAAMVGAGIMAAVHQPLLAGIFLSVPVVGIARAFIESTARSLRSDTAANSDQPSAANTPSTAVTPDASAQPKP
jgi:hypothetical protein